MCGGIVSTTRRFGALRWERRAADSSRRRVGRCVG
jgi:hypothetical protein